MTSANATPILTVPENLHFDISPSSSSPSPSPHEEEDNTSSNDSGGYDIYLNENWDSGIGGGLWTTGSALAKYFTTSPHFLQQIKRIRQNNNNEVEGGGDDDDDDNNNRRRRPLRVLELGSGNGFLSVCLVVAVAVATANMNNNDDENDSNNENNLNNNDENNFEQQQ